MGKFIDLTGMRFGKLTVIEYIKGDGWHCVCECGNHKYKIESNRIVQKRNNKKWFEDILVMQMQMWENQTS